MIQWRCQTLSLLRGMLIKRSLRTIIYLRMQWIHLTLRSILILTEGVSEILKSINEEIKVEKLSLGGKLGSQLDQATKRTLDSYAGVLYRRMG